MIRLRKYIILVIAVLLNCSISWCQNDTILPTGEVEQDSVLVPITAIRVANAKMIELKYEKVINENLKQNIVLDSILIDVLETNLESCVYQLEEQSRICEEEVSRIKKQRNIAIGAGSGSSAILLAILLLVLL